MRWLIAFFATLTLFTGLATADEREDLCGWVFPVESYRADIDGLEIVLNANDRLIVNGRTLAEYNPWRDGEMPAAWGDSANGASVGTLGSYILVRTMSTDCVDYASTRVYVLSRSGELIATTEVPPHDSWTRFNLAPDGLTYSSEFYCGQYSGAEAGNAVLWVMREGGFVRQEQSWASICSDDVARRVNAAQFNRMQPISPARP
jgi:hypothetical protein